MFFGINHFAQIDTTILYPLDIGNYWEYTNYTSAHWYYKIIDEEVMPNGKTYKKFIRVNLVSKDTSYSYYRVEDNNKVFWYRHKVSNPNEIKIFDFTLSEGELWKETNFYAKVQSKRIEYHSLVQDSLLTISKNYWYIDTTKTPPDTSFIFDIYSKFAKGIGPTLYGAHPTVKLTGLIIKGVKYGFISVGINDEKEQIPNDYELKISAYPNPFNSSTNIIFNNPVKQKIKISIINLLGQSISEITDKYFLEGEQKIFLKMPLNISAGTYFVLLKTNNRIYTKKIMYLK